MSPTRTSGRTQRSTRSRITRRLAIATVTGAGVLALSGCTAEQRDDFSRGYLLEPVTKEGETIAHLWNGSWIAAMLVGILVWGLIGWAIVAYSRRRRPGYPVQTRYNLPIEILWTVVPFVIIGVLFVFTVRDQNKILTLKDNPDVTIGVVGFRWSWAFNYVDEEAYDVGLPATENATGGTAEGVDQGYTGPTLYLPEGERVRFVLTTPDVIHSFYVPSFLMKMDLMPGRTNQFEVTTTKAGTYVGKCAELCGLDHARMLFNVKVVSREEYDEHIESLKASGQDGLFDSGRVTDLADRGQGRTLTDTDQGRSTSPGSEGASE